MKKNLNHDHLPGSTVFRSCLCLLAAGLFLRCTSVQDFAPLNYPDGEIPEAGESILAFAPAPPPGTVAVPSRLLTRDVEAALQKAGLPPGVLEAAQKSRLAGDGILLLDDPELARAETLEAAYELLAKRGWPLLLTGEAIAGRYLDMIQYLFEAVEEQQVAPSLQGVLLAMTQVSLRQYSLSEGSMKEAAWRNTVLLCVASRIINPEAPTPFVVSGMVRRELDLIQKAAGEYPSPLRSLDSRGNPCLVTGQPGCRDYRVFQHHPWLGENSRLAATRRALLWLALNPLDLSDGLQLTQALLLTSCLKSAEVPLNGKPFAGARVWNAIWHFYQFGHGLESGFTFAGLDRFLRENFPAKFSEARYFERAALLKWFQDHPECASLRKQLFILFPEYRLPFDPFYQTLVFPAIGPDTVNPLYRQGLLPNLAKACGQGGLVPARRERSWLDCQRLSLDDYLFLYCSARNASQAQAGLLDLFRVEPCAGDLLETAGWGSSGDPRPRTFCRLETALANQTRALQQRSASEWGRSLPGLLLWCIQQSQPQQIFPAGRNTTPVLAWQKKRAYALLCQPPLTGTPALLRRPPAVPEFPATARLLVEPAPRMYYCLGEMTEHIRKVLMLLEYSDLELDDLLIQYSNLADELIELSTSIENNQPLTAIQEHWLANLGRRLQFIETRLCLKTGSRETHVLRRLFPREVSLWQSTISPDQLLIIGGNCQLSICAFPLNGSVVVAAAPQPAYFEMIAHRRQPFTGGELQQLLKQGIPFPLN